MVKVKIIGLYTSKEVAFNAGKGVTIESITKDLQDAVQNKKHFIVTDKDDVIFVPYELLCQSLVHAVEENTTNADD